MINFIIVIHATSDIVAIPATCQNKPIQQDIDSNKMVQSEQLSNSTVKQTEIIHVKRISVYTRSERDTHSLRHMRCFFHCSGHVIQKL
jgi:hypothetical protein